MTEEQLTPQQQYLEDLLMKTEQLPSLRDEEFSFGGEDFPRVANLSRLFLQVFTTSMKESQFKPRELDVVIPGGSFYEVIGVLLAAKAVGISGVNVAVLENQRPFLDFQRDRLSEIFDLPLEDGHSAIFEPTLGTDEEEQPLGRVTLKIADAKDPAEARNIRLNSDSLMVFVGNPGRGSSSIFTNWARIGRESGKKFLLAATATGDSGDRERVRDEFADATRRERLTAISINDTLNTYALQETRSNFMTHRFKFVAVG